MANLNIAEIVADADVTTAAGLVDFLALVDDYEADLIRLLARLGDDDARAALSESQADVAGATAEGWRELGAQIDAVDDPSQHGPNPGRADL